MNKLAQDYLKWVGPTPRGQAIANILTAIIMSVAIAALQDMVDLETMAGVTIGLGALGMMANFSSGDFKNRKFNLILHILVTGALIAVAACILAGQLPEADLEAAPALFLSLTVLYVAIRLFRFSFTYLYNMDKEADASKGTPNVARAMVDHLKKQGQEERKKDPVGYAERRLNRNGVT